MKTAAIILGALLAFWVASAILGGRCVDDGTAGAAQLCADY